MNVVQTAPQLTLNGKVIGEVFQLRENVQSVPTGTIRIEWDVEAYRALSLVYYADEVCELHVTGADFGNLASVKLQALSTIHNWLGKFIDVTPVRVG